MKLITLALLAIFAASAQADLYIFTDEEGVVHVQDYAPESDYITDDPEILLKEALFREEEFERWTCDYAIPTGLDVPNPFEPEEWKAWQVFKEECNK